VAVCSLEVHPGLLPLRLPARCGHALGKPSPSSMPAANSDCFYWPASLIPVFLCFQCFGYVALTLILNPFARANDDRMNVRAVPRPRSQFQLPGLNLCSACSSRASWASSCCCWPARCYAPPATTPIRAPQRSAMLLGAAMGSLPMLLDMLAAAADCDVGGADRRDGDGVPPLCDARAQARQDAVPHAPAQRGRKGGD
jgi:hypothetical protein